MKQLRFLLTYFLTWIVFFQLSRGVFMLYHSTFTKQLSFSTGLKSFLYGLRMDLSMTAYIVLPICIFVMAGLFIRFFARAFLYKIYTAIILFPVLLILAADIELYRQWHFRIDDTPLKYLSSPREAWASVSHLPIYWILFFFCVIYVLSILIFSYFIQSKSRFLLPDQAGKMRSFFVVLAFTCLLIFPIRGGWQLAPLNQSGVYFSKKIFANHAAINAAWNFLHALMNRSSKKNPYFYLSSIESAAITDSLYKSPGETEILLNISNPNVILIIWESFSEKITRISVGGEEVTPKFNSLKKDGIYFNEVYASGDRTDKGLAAILSAYPALPKQSILRSPNKAAKLASLPKEFLKLHYKTSFYYGGEPEFANIKSYLLNAGFNTIIEKNNFPKKDLNSKWGAHDGTVAKKLIEDLNPITTPFFATWLTLSSHEPFEIPESVKFKGTDMLSRLFSAHHYTDKVIFEFIERCKKAPWWSKTLLVIISDHGHPLPVTGRIIDNFKVPMLWLGGALNKTGYVNGNTASQVDLASTIMKQIKLDSPFPLGKDILNSGNKPWSFFSFNDGFGFVQPGKSFVFDNIGRRLLYTNNKSNEKDIKAGQALQQNYYANYMNR